MGRKTAETVEKIVFIEHTIPQNLLSKIMLRISITDSHGQRARQVCHETRKPSPKNGLPHSEVKNPVIILRL